MSAQTDDLFQFEEEAPSAAKRPAAPVEPWRVLLVDDEPAIHEVTKIALAGYEFQGRRIDFVSAFSEREARAILQGSAELALVFLDVVMERPSSGLDIVRFIRDTLHNESLQVILRTGQPGEAPEETIVKELGINDYKLKTELTREKLFSVVSLSLRAYQQSRRLTEMSRDLLEANAALAQVNLSLEDQVAERTKELVQKSSSLEEAVAEKRNLLRIMAHDLRNYLTIVLGNSSRMWGEATPEMSKKRLDRIHWAASCQSDLIDRVIEFEATTSGKKAMKVAVTPLKQLIEQSVKTFEDRVAEKNLTLTVSWGCSLSVCVLVEPQTFTYSVLNNIISNAIKFSEPGGLIIIEPSLDALGQVVIKIQDEGMGMPPEILRGLFAFDKRTSRAGTQGERGTGFGMPIVKSLLEHMNGSIQVESHEKSDASGSHGTTFKLTVKTAA